jgi:hypothetical protein
MFLEKKTLREIQKHSYHSLQENLSPEEKQLVSSDLPSVERKQTIRNLLQNVEHIEANSKPLHAAAIKIQDTVSNFKKAMAIHSQKQAD